MYMGSICVWGFTYTLLPDLGTHLDSFKKKSSMIKTKPTYAHQCLAGVGVGRDRVGGGCARTGLR